jgi:hypothetical protein
MSNYTNNASEKTHSNISNIYINILYITTDNCMMVILFIQKLILEIDKDNTMYKFYKKR